MIGLSPHNLSGTVNAIGSKSFAHRALISAALFGSTRVTVRGITPSEDVSATARCLNAIGAKVELCGDGATVCPIGEIPSEATLDCGESGSTLRFMMPIAAALGIKTEFVGSGRLLDRPNDELIKTLASGGVTVENKRFLSGRLKGGDYEISASVSSQYVTGMLFALILAGGGTLKLNGKIVSREYLKITESVLEDFGQTVTFSDGTYTAAAKKPTAVTDYKVEGDWSNAAFFLVAGALSSRSVTVDGLNPDSVQGDKKIIDVIAAAGAEVTVSGNAVTVRKSNLNGFTADATDIPDAVPAISVLAAYCAGETAISGVERLKIKESDRLGEVIKMLGAAGIKAYGGDELRIEGGFPHGGAFDSANDHRMAMSEAILAAFADGDSTIDGESAVKKSYPDFYKDYKKIGGVTYEI